MIIVLSEIRAYVRIHRILLLQLMKTLPTIRRDSGYQRDKQLLIECQSCTEIGESRKLSRQNLPERNLMEAGNR